MKRLKYSKRECMENERKGRGKGSHDSQCNEDDLNREKEAMDMKIVNRQNMVQTHNYDVISHYTAP